MKIKEHEKGTCDFNHFKRARYFHGMLLGDKDFKDEQEYHLAKRRLLNRTLHGCGVVCGLDLKCKGNDVEVSPGLALDCCGREIVVCKPEPIPIKECLCLHKKSSSKPPMTPEECKELEREGGKVTCYVGIRYHEMKANPVPVHVPGGGCEERICQPSRWQEGYCIQFFPECPDSCCRSGPSEPWLENAAQRMAEFRDDKERKWEKAECMAEFVRLATASSACPDCCCGECWVTLGKVTIDGNECRENPAECRQYALGGETLQRLVALLSLLVRRNTNPTTELEAALAKNESQLALVRETFGRLVERLGKGGRCQDVYNDLRNDKKLRELFPKVY